MSERPPLNRERRQVSAFGRIGAIGMMSLALMGCKTLEASADLDCRDSEPVDAVSRTFSLGSNTLVFTVMGENGEQRTVRVDLTSMEPGDARARVSDGSGRWLTPFSEARSNDGPERVSGNGAYFAINFGGKGEGGEAEKLYDITVAVGCDADSTLAALSAVDVAAQQ